MRFAKLTEAASQNSLQAPKIYSLCHMNCRFSVLAVNFRTQPERGDVATFASSTVASDVIASSKVPCENAGKFNPTFLRSILTFPCPWKSS